MRLAYGALALGTLLWASLHPVAKLAVREISPLELTFLRALLAAGALLGFCLLSGRQAALRETLRHGWRGAVGLGLLGYLGSSLMSMIAVSYLPAAAANLLGNTTPLWVAVGAAVLLGERLRRRVLGGLLAGFAGVAVLAAGGSRSPFELGATFGIGIALLGSALWAVHTAWTRKMALRFDPVALTAVGAVVATPLLGLAMLLSGQGAAVSTASDSARLAVLWAGVMGTAGTYLTWAIALRHLPAASVAAFQYFVPVISAVMALLLLGEPITLALAAGTALIVGGVAAAQSR